MGFNWESMAINTPFEVSHLGFHIKSLNKELNEDCQSLITKIVRKDNARAFLVKTLYGEFFASEEHRLAIRELDVIKWQSLKDLGESEVWAQTGPDTFMLCSIAMTNKIVPILDIEVAGTHSYYTAGVLSHNCLFGNPETTSGGNALKYYASQRLDIRKTASTKNVSGEAISNTVKVKVIKNKVAPPFREAELTIEFGTGLNLFAEIFDLATEFKLIEQSGSWLMFPKAGNTDSFRLQGRQSGIEYLKNNPEYFEILEKEVRERMFGELAQIQSESPPSEEAEESFDE